MKSKLNREAPVFNFRKTPTAWRAVDLATTKLIAKRCTRGRDFTGCSKSLIYESVARPFQSDCSQTRKFMYLMGAAARISSHLKREMRKQLAQKLDELAAKFDAGQPL